MRQIILDTETTGLDPRQGHRIIEVAAVELLNRRLTGQSFHRYLNPDRDIEEGALQVHGITREFLEDKPRFPDIAEEFAAFIKDAELVIHNAPFDVSFLNAEFSRLGESALDQYCRGVVDTLALARSLHPGQRNSLDALCKRYEIDNSSRRLHGALLDCELLAQVYLAMTRGQEALLIEPHESTAVTRVGAASRQRPAVLRVALSIDEQSAHAASLDEIERESGGNCLWRKLAAT
jgi:DNA polymerase-3 subunit epsilon